MRAVALLLSACLVVPFLAPAPARADDPFAAYRIPDHAWRSGSLRLSTLASQIVRQSLAEREDRDLASTALGSFSWTRDSEPLRMWAGLSVQGSADIASDRLELPYARQRVWASNGSERVSLEAGARFYPNDGPLGWELSGYGSGSWQQYLNRIDMRQSATVPPDGPRYELQARELFRTDAHTTIAEAQAGPVYGRVRDASPVYDVYVIEGRLLEAGALAGPLSVRARERLAAVLAATENASAAHDRPARFRWREVERVLREEGAIGEAGLDAYAALRIGEGLSPRYHFLRQRGRLFGPLLMATTANYVARGMHEYESRFTVDDSLYDASRTVDRILPGHAAIDLYWAGAQAEFHQPLGWRWQLDASGRGAASIRTGTHGYQWTSSVGLGWDIADRWAAQLDVHQQRLDLEPNTLSPVWEVWYQISIAYFLEDRTSISLSAYEDQYRLTAGGDYLRARQVNLGLTYRFLGAVDAPGVMEPMRPIH